MVTSSLDCIELRGPLSVFDDRPIAFAQARTFTIYLVLPNRDILVDGALSFSDSFAQQYPVREGHRHFVHGDHRMHFGVLLIDGREVKSKRVEQFYFRVDNSSIHGSTESVKENVERSGYFGDEKLRQAEDAVVLKGPVNKNRSVDLNSFGPHPFCLLAMQKWKMSAVHAVFTKVLDMNSYGPMLCRCKRRPLV